MVEFLAGGACFTAWIKREEKRLYSSSVADGATFFRLILNLRIKWKGYGVN
jgi:hypothetical protein